MQPSSSLACSVVLEAYYKRIIARVKLVRAHTNAAAVSPSWCIVSSSISLVVSKHTKVKRKERKEKTYVRYTGLSLRDSSPEGLSIIISTNYNASNDELETGVYQSPVRCCLQTPAYSECAGSAGLVSIISSTCQTTLYPNEFLSHGQSTAISSNPCPRSVGRT